MYFRYFKEQNKQTNEENLFPVYVFGCNKALKLRWIIKYRHFMLFFMAENYVNGTKTDECKIITIRPCTSVSAHSSFLPTCWLALSWLSWGGRDVTAISHRLIASPKFVNEWWHFVPPSAQQAVITSFATRKHLRAFVEFVCRDLLMSSLFFMTKFYYGIRAK